MYHAVHAGVCGESAVRTLRARLHVGPYEHHRPRLFPAVVHRRYNVRVQGLLDGLVHSQDHAGVSVVPPLNTR